MVSPPTLAPGVAVVALYTRVIPEKIMLNPKHAYTQ
jgi:hypothetical protein